MCGVAGLVWGESATLRGDPGVLVDEMARSMAHRGPDGFGTWVDANAGIALSHRRLAIIDLTSSGTQPMTSMCGRYTLSYNGEIYNYLELRRFVDARARGWNWRGTSDTEVLLALFSLLGIQETLTKIDGMFAIAVWDHQRRTISLIRDRFGEKPLSYSLRDGVLAFASEVQAIKHAFNLGNEDIAPEALAALLSIQTIPAPLSIFSGVHKLPAAGYVEISQKDIAARKLPASSAYWDVASIAESSSEKKFAGSFADAVERCRELLAESVKSRTIADVPLGAMLSSGTDSTCIAALAQIARHGQLKTYTISVAGDGFDEAAAAAGIAEKLGTKHTSIPVGINECLEAAQSILSVYDEPFADQSQIVTYVLARAIRSDVTVALSGDGGDELFAGYARHTTGPKLWSGIKNIPKIGRKALDDSSRLIGPARIAKLVTSVMALNGRLPTGETKNRIQKALRSISANSDADFYGRLLSESSDAELVVGHEFDPALLYIDIFNSDIFAEKFLKNIMISDTRNYLPETVLTKVDRATMAVSLESRAPFLNAKIFEFAWSLPSSYLLKNGQGKAVTRALASSFVGPEALSRPKQGFGVPLGDWLKGPLRNWASDIISSSNAKFDPFLNMGEVSKLWQRHQDGQGDQSQQIWAILSYLGWKENL